MYPSLKKSGLRRERFRRCMNGVSLEGEDCTESVRSHAYGDLQDLHLGKHREVKPVMVEWRWSNER